VFEKYLDLLPFKLRTNLSRLRLCSIKLAIETGRYSRNRTDRNQRVCKLCNHGDIEDEYHFVLICPAFEHIRKIYLKQYYYVRPSVFKFTELLQNDCKKEIINLARYVYNGVQLRNLLL